MRVGSARVKEEFLLVSNSVSDNFVFPLCPVSPRRKTEKAELCQREHRGFGRKCHTYIFRTTHNRAIFLVFPILGDEQIHIPSGRFGKS